MATDPTKTKRARRDKKVERFMHHGVRIQVRKVSKEEMDRALERDSIDVRAVDQSISRQKRDARKKALAAAEEAWRMRIDPILRAAEVNLDHLAVKDIERLLNRIRPRYQSSQRTTPRPPHRPL